MRKHIFSTIALASFAWAATFVSGQGGAGRAPQNGSGRGPASNSQQTSKGSTRPTARVASLAGTVWDFKDSNDADSTYEFLAGGKLTNGIGNEATWRQRGRQVVIDYGDGQVETGTITGNQMSGTGKLIVENENGKKETQRYKWNAKRQSDND